MATRGEATRTMLVETAERLFAEQGIVTVSLRDISAAAGQRNHSAAQYHFGDRAGLVAAVFAHRMHLVNERRHPLLDQLAAEARDDDLLALVDATIRPLAAVVDETNGWYGRFLVRTRWDQFARDVVAGLPVLSSYRRAIDLLGERLTHLPLSARGARLDQMTTLFVGTIAGWEWRCHNGRPVPPLDERCRDLVATCHAVLATTARRAAETAVAADSVPATPAITTI